MSGSDKKCCVPGCTDNDGKHQVLHKFPNPLKDKDRFETWIKYIGGDILGLDDAHIYKYRRVCHVHFEEKYLCRNNRISKDAIPTINISGCKSHTGKKENKNNQEAISFHRFPGNEQIKNEWILRNGRSNWTWNKRSHICSRHFTQDSFVPNENIKWRRLKADALPTLYLSDTDTLEIVSEPIMVVCDMEPEESLPNICEEDVQVKKEIVPEPIMVVCDMEPEESLPNICEEDVQEKKKPHAACKCEAIISRLKQELERVKRISRRRLRKINTLTKRLSRLDKKNDDLCTILVDRLEQENIDNEYVTLLENLNKND